MAYQVKYPELSQKYRFLDVPNNGDVAEGRYLNDIVWNQFFDSAVNSYRTNVFTSLGHPIRYSRVRRPGVDVNVNECITRFKLDINPRTEWIELGINYAYYDDNVENTVARPRLDITSTSCVNTTRFSPEVIQDFAPNAFAPPSCGLDFIKSSDSIAELYIEAQTSFNWQFARASTEATGTSRHGLQLNSVQGNWRTESFSVSLVPTLFLNPPAPTPSENRANTHFIITDIWARCVPTLGYDFTII